MYAENLIVSQHLLKRMSLAITKTDDSRTENFTNEIDYTYEFDATGRPSKIHINSSTMGHAMPTRSFLIQYSNCN